MQAPSEGRVIIGDDTKFVGPEQSAVFDQIASGNPHVTFISDEVRATVLSVPGDSLDFAGFLEQGVDVRGALVPISVVLEPAEGGEFVIVSDGQRFQIDPEGPPNTVEVPSGRDVVAIAVWRSEGTTHWTIRNLGRPTELDGHLTTLKPAVQVQNTTVVHLETGPPGWMTAELVYQGVRTGLIVGEGRVGASVGSTIATTGQIDDKLSLWVDIRAHELGPKEGSYHIGASLPLDRPSVSLAWVEQSLFSPGLQRAGEALPIDAAPLAWSVDSLDSDTDTFAVEMKALGLCRNVTWQVIGPMSGDTDLPILDTENVLSAPLIQQR